MKRILIPLVVLCLLTSLLLTNSIATISHSPEINFIAIAPASVQPGVLESNGEIKVFQEQSNSALLSSVGVDISAPGTYGPLPSLVNGIPTLTPSTLAAGTVVHSYFLHFDPVGAPGTELTIQGSITFDTDILGIVIFTNPLISSDAGLGVPGTLYSTGAQRGLEEGDVVSLSADRRTLTVQLHALSSTVDQLRVITKPGADPPRENPCPPGLTTSLPLSQISPPASVQLGALESDQEIRMFSERINVTLAGSVGVDISTPGTYGPFPLQGIPPLSPSTIPAGTVVSSFLLHFDPVGAPLVRLTRGGSVTFGANIIGLIVLSDHLDNTDGILGAAGTSYSLGQFRGLEPSDIVTVSADLRTLTVQLYADTQCNQIRVITASTFDTDPPVFNCPGSISVTGQCSSEVTYNIPTATDNCSSAQVVCMPPPGTVFPIGTTTVTCTATDASNNSASCSFTVTITNTQQPSVNCSVSQSSLWPPNHDLENVGLSVTAVNSCTDPSGNGPTVTVTVYADEDDETQTGDGNHSPDAKNIASATLRLRAERKGDSNGRVYLIIVRATDFLGNVGVCTSTVVVPHSMNRAAIDSVNAQAVAAKAYYLANGTPPPGYVIVGDGAIIGPKQ
jgi:hypothetical protein